MTTSRSASADTPEQILKRGVGKALRRDPPPGGEPMPPGTPAPLGCPLCDGDGGERVWRGTDCRVVLADEPDYPGFTRVIWNGHVAEMTDLDHAGRARLMEVVYLVEAVQRSVLAPRKINLASLGNMVPHLHWHVIPRWEDDPAFPDAVWALPKRPRARAAPDLPAYVEKLHAALQSAAGEGGRTAALG